LCPAGFVEPEQHLEHNSTFTSSTLAMDDDDEDDEDEDDDDNDDNVSVLFTRANVTVNVALDFFSR
jgi:hypothetical protein